MTISFNSNAFVLKQYLLTQFKAMFMFTTGFKNILNTD